jgi:hypothetical protein
MGTKAVIALLGADPGRFDLVQPIVVFNVEFRNAPETRALEPATTLDLKRVFSKRSLKPI